jgi:hypothetical protein
MKPTTNHLVLRSRMMQLELHFPIRLHVMVLHCIIKSRNNFTLPYAFEITPNGIITASNLIKIHLVIFDLKHADRRRDKTSPLYVNFVRMVRRINKNVNIQSLKSQNSPMLSPVSPINYVFLLEKCSPYAALQSVQTLSKLAS